MTHNEQKNERMGRRGGKRSRGYNHRQKYYNDSSEGQDKENIVNNYLVIDYIQLPSINATSHLLSIIKIRSQINYIFNRLKEMNTQPRIPY